MLQTLVRDVMTSEVVTVGPEATVAEVARLLTEHRISGLPVVEDGRVIGIVSEADLLWRESRLHGPVYISLLDAVIPLGQSAFGEELRRAAAATARDVMSHPAIQIVPDAPVEVAATRMLDNEVNRLPVVDGRGHLVGIVARRDLIRSLARPES